MKTFYHCLIMWVPFIVLFALAGYGVEAIEGNKIRTSEYLSLGIGFYVFIMCSVAFVFYLVSFLPLTFVVNKFVNALLVKGIIFTFSGGVIGAIAFGKIYEARFIEEYNLNIMSAVSIFSLAGLLYALVDHAVRRNIKFV